MSTTSSSYTWIIKILLISSATFLFGSAGFAQQLQQRDQNSIDLDSTNIDTYYSGEEGFMVDEMLDIKESLSLLKNI